MSNPTQLKQNSGDGFLARKQAVDILYSVLQKKEPLDTALEQVYATQDKVNVPSRDQAFVRAIVSAALRHKIQIEAIIAQFLAKPLPRKCGYLREIFLSAGAQLLFLGTPPHAVIDLSVRLCKRHNATQRFAKLTNAVLRRVSEQGQDKLADQNNIDLYQHSWMFQHWQNTYGVDTALKIAHAHTIEPALDLAFKPDHQDEAQSLATQLDGALLPTGQIRLKTGGRVEEIPSYDDGVWWVQDMAAYLPVILLGDVKDQEVADLCAAPGGKTAQLCALGAKVTAVEASKKRIKRLKQNMSRLRFHPNIAHANVLEWQPKQKFDAVLLDAPCSATGTIRRHPDIPYLKSEQDIQELCALQKNLLKAALDFLKPGGTLVYCTCSLEPEEGLHLIQEVLKSGPNLILNPITAEKDLYGYENWIEQGSLRTFPFSFQHDDERFSGMDGFFAARLIKK
ncbi:MAG: RsmB/NOP family class I SAM-dependent RNA methyltransferase [Pseudomonadota bacterium]